MKSAFCVAIAVTLFHSELTLAQGINAKGASAPPPIIPGEFVAKVVDVLDGETIRVANPEISIVSVRLEGIDAPESNQEFGPDAKKYLTNLLLKKQVTVVWKVRDENRRLLAFVYLEKTLINKSLVEEGYAWQDKNNKSEALKSVETGARTQRKGLWANASPIAPWDYRAGVRAPKAELPKVVDKPPTEAKKVPPRENAPVSKEDPIVYITKTGTHYHRAGCRDLKKSATPIPLSRAASVYAPCHHCNPSR